MKLCNWWILVVSICLTAHVVKAEVTSLSSTDESTVVSTEGTSLSSAPPDPTELSTSDVQSTNSSSLPEGSSSVSMDPSTSEPTENTSESTSSFVHETSETTAISETSSTETGTTGESSSVEFSSTSEAATTSEMSTSEQMTTSEEKSSSFTETSSTSETTGESTEQTTATVSSSLASQGSSVEESSTTESLSSTDDVKTTAETSTEMFSISETTTEQTSSPVTESSSATVSSSLSSQASSIEESSTTESLSSTGNERTTTAETATHSPVSELTVPTGTEQTSTGATAEQSSTTDVSEGSKSSTESVTDEPTDALSTGSGGTTTDGEITTSSALENTTTEISDVTTGVTDKATTTEAAVTTSGGTSVITTVTETSTATVTETSIATVTETSTANVTETSTATVTETSTATVTETSTANVTETSTATVTETSTATVTVTSTATVTETSTATVTETSTKTVTETSTNGTSVTPGTTSPTSGTSTTTVSPSTGTSTTTTSTSAASTATTPTAPTTACKPTETPEPCPEGFTGQGIKICKCEDRDCTVDLSGCNNLWLGEVKCTEDLSGVNSIVEGVGSGTFLGHEIDNILKKLDECREESSADPTDVTSSTLQAVDSIFSSSAWKEGSEEGRLANIISSTDLLTKLGTDLLKSPSCNGDCSVTQGSSEISARKSKQQEKFAFANASVIVPESDGDRDIVVYCISGEDIAPASASSYGLSGKMNTPLLGLSVAPSGRSSLPSSRLQNGKGVIVSFEHNFKIQGSYETVRRSPFKDEKPTIREGSMECSYLVSLSNTSNPFWGTDGCRLLSSSATRTECSCDFIGTFGAIGQAHQFVGLPFELDIVWYVFTILAIVCCVFSVLILITRPPLQQNKIGQIKRFGLLNLLFCVTVTEFMILLFMNKSKFYLDAGSCTAVGAILHYFALAAFTWVTIEGFVLFREVRSPAEFNTTRSLMYLPLGYIFPGLFVAAALLEAHFIESDVTQAYADPAVCWLTSPDYVWNFYAPALFLTIVDVIVMIYAVDSAYKVAEKKQTFVSNAVRSWWKISVGMALLLAVTWTFGFFILDANVEMVYIFIVLNGVQGIFLLVSTIFMFKKENTKAKEEEGEKKDELISPISAYNNPTNDPAFPPVILRSRFGGPERPRESSKLSEPAVDYPMATLQQSRTTLESLPPPSTKPLIPRVSIKRELSVYAPQPMEGRRLGQARDNYGFVSDTEASMGKKSARNDEYKQKVKRYDADVYY